MLVLYRPYLNCTKSVNCLYSEDKALMKLKSYLLLRCIFEKKKWLPRTEVYEEYKKHLLVKFYYNGGKPYVDLLLEYYYNAYVYWLKEGGERIDFCKGYEKIYQENKKKCADGDPWKKSHALFHKMLLLKRNHKWYKRFFRKYFEKTIDDYSEYVKGKPRRIKNQDLRSSNSEN